MYTVLKLYQRVLDNVALWLAHHRVHADLSAFNILYWQGTVKVIDFPQSVDPRQSPSAWDLLQRDLENVHRYFARYGIEGDPVWITHDLRRQYIDPRYRASRASRARRTAPCPDSAPAALYGQGRSTRPVAEMTVASLVPGVAPAPHAIGTPYRPAGGTLGRLLTSCPAASRDHRA